MAPGLKRHDSSPTADNSSIADADPEHADRASQRQLVAPAATHLMDDVDEVGRILGAPVAGYALRPSPDPAYTVSRLATTVSSPEQQHAGKQQVPPDALGAFLRFVSRRTA